MYISENYKLHLRHSQLFLWYFARDEAKQLTLQFLDSAEETKV